ncbi:MAG: hypothetical protein JWM34_2705 [Ilumatobacteraceae bacterium]|nr:hypothetical protein [Ilumatobacteraceae bacterium]
MRHDRRPLVVVACWVLGAAWILIPHPGEGRVLYVITERFGGLGIHLTDPLGVVVPILVTVALSYRPRRR